MPRRKKSSSTEPPPEVTLTSPPEEPSSRDASLLNADDFPMRALGLTEREFRFQAIFTQQVLNAIHEHGKTSLEAEICGVLVGNVYRDAQGPYVLVHASIRGDSADSRNAQVTFKAETWTHIQQSMERDHPNARIVGWYHTHPGFGIFLSGMDLFIQDHFFNLPWQIALVYDPQSEEEGVFIWRAGKSEREPHLVEPGDTPATPTRQEEVPSPAPASITPRTWLLAGILFVASFGITYGAISLLRGS